MPDALAHRPIRDLARTLPEFTNEFATAPAEKAFKDHIPHLQDSEGVDLNTVRTFLCKKIPLSKGSVGPRIAHACGISSL